MNRLSLTLLVLLSATTLLLHAEDVFEPQKEVLKTTDAREFLGKITPEMLYGYTDFHFNSTTTENFNRFKGHSNLYSTGADHIFLKPSLMAGLYYFRIETTLSGKFLFLPGSLTTSEETIKNNTLFGHILKIFTQEIYADLAGGYGQNQMNTVTQINQSPINEELIAHARNGNNNWFLSLNGIYRKLWQKLLLRANLGVLYSQINTGRYHYMFPATDQIQEVISLTNRATLILENLELGYFINPKWMPFISGGLLQVAQFSNSRPVLSATTLINGSLPQLNMNKSGFRLGGGVSYSYKNITARLEEKYYNAGGTFESHQTLVTLEYQFN